MQNRLNDGLHNFLLAYIEDCLNVPKNNEDMADNAPAARVLRKGFAIKEEYLKKLKQSVRDLKLEDKPVLDPDEVLGEFLEVVGVSEENLSSSARARYIGFYNADKGKWEGTNAKIVEKLAEAGADYIICHSIVGISSIQECVEVAHSKGSKVLTLPYMTHKGANLFFAHPLNIKHVSDVLNKTGLKVDQNRLEACNTISDVILVLGDILNVDGYIGPANNQLIIKRYRELTPKDIYGPGIGRQAIENLSPKDQLASFYRTCGSRSAAIIGSAIYGVSDPAKSAKEFKEWRDEIVTQI